MRRRTTYEMLEMLKNALDNVQMLVPERAICLYEEFDIEGINVSDELVYFPDGHVEIDRVAKLPAAVADFSIDVNFAVSGV